MKSDSGRSDGSSAGYVPVASADHVARIQRWHDRAYREGLATQGSVQVFEYLGAVIEVPDAVMPITPTSHLLGEAVLAETRCGESVLDMGTGSGVNAVLAASKGADVIAVDINPRALEAATANAQRNAVADRIEVRHSDVFSDVSETFDLIVFDPPFRWLRPRDLLEAAMTDDGYQAMTTFVRQARNHLSPGGRMLIFFGTTGDLAYLQQLLSDERFDTAVVASEALTKDGWTVEYFTFRVT